MKRTPSIKFFKKKKDTEGEETLCNVPIISTSPLKEARSLTSDLSPFQDIPRKKRDAIARTRKKVVTQVQILPIKEELGSCWKNLGTALGLEAAKLQNIEEDYRLNREKATAVLQTWMDEKGNDATVGLLADVLEKIGKKRFADKLLDSEVKNEEETITNYSYDRELGDEQDGAKGQEQQVEVSKALQDELKKKEKQIRELTSKLEDEEKRTQELEQKVEELNKELSTSLKEETKKLTTELKSEGKRASDLEQKVDESKILEEQLATLEEKTTKNKQLIQEHNKELTSEQEKTKELEQKVEESKVLENEMLQEEATVKDDANNNLSSELSSEQERAKELERKVEESKILDDQLKSLQKEFEVIDETIDKLFSELTNKQERAKELAQGEESNLLAKQLQELAQQLKQQIDESRVLAVENKHYQDEKIKRLESELEEAEILANECDRLEGEVKKREENINELTSDLKDEQKRVNELEQQVHELTILEEEFKKLSPR